MKLSLSSALLISAVGGLIIGCGMEVSEASTAQDLALTSPAESTAEAPAPECTFLKGVTTCVTTTQSIETSTHEEISGCVAVDGTKFVPGRRSRTFVDQLEITMTTTTLQHGRNGKVFNTSTDTQTEILSSMLISDACELL